MREGKTCKKMEAGRELGRVKKTVRECMTERGWGWSSVEPNGGKGVRGKRNSATPKVDGEMNWEKLGAKIGLNELSVDTAVNRWERPLPCSRLKLLG